MAAVSVHTLQCSLWKFKVLD